MKKEYKVKVLNKILKFYGKLAEWFKATDY